MRITDNYDISPAHYTGAYIIMKNTLRKLNSYIPQGIICLVVVFGIFAYIASQMGTPQMLNT